MWITGCQSVRMACNAARDPANLVVGDSSLPSCPPATRFIFFLFPWKSSNWNEEEGRLNEPSDAQRCAGWFER